MDQRIGLMASERARDDDPAQKFPRFFARALGHEGKKIRVKEVPCIEHNNSLFLYKGHSKKALG
jgi:hypothetical protein